MSTTDRGGAPPVATLQRRGARAGRAGLGAGVGAAASLVLWIAARADAEPTAPWLVAVPGAALMVVLLPGLALACCLRRLSGSLAPGAAAAGAAAASMVTFWGWWLDPRLGQILVVALPVASGALVGASASPRHRRALSAALLVTALVTVMCCAVTFDRGPTETDIAHAVSLRYWVSVDNKLPELIGTRLVEGQPLRPEIVGGWQSSDRPPLAVGTFLQGYGLGRSPFVGWASLVAAGGAWVLALWSLLRCLGVGRTVVPAVVTAVALCGPVFANTVYTWPKITAAALAMVALAATFDERSPSALRATLIGAATALAMLCHGSAVFATIGLIPFLYVRRRSFRLTHLAIGISVAAGLYAPWLLYQRLWDPPGDRLLYWHLAGTWIDSPDQRSFPAALIGAYREAGPWGVLTAKLANLRVLVDPTYIGTNTALAASSGPFAWLRTTQLSRVAWAPGILWLGLPFVIMGWARSRALQVLVASTGTTTLAYVIVEWGGHPDAMAFLYTAPLTIVILPAAALALAAATRLSTTGLVVALVACAVTFFATWSWTVGQQAAAGGAAGAVHLDTAALAAVAAVALLLVAVGSARGLKRAEVP